MAKVHGSNHVDMSAWAIRGVALACLLHQAGHECELTGNHPQTNNRMELKAAIVCIWRSGPSVMLPKVKAVWDPDLILAKDGDRHPLIIRQINIRIGKEALTLLCCGGHRLENTSLGP